MGRYLEDSDDWSDDDDWGDDSDDSTIPCPSCGKEIYEDSPRCPHCGQYITEEDAPTRQPWWIILGVILCLCAAAVWIISW